MAIQIRIMADDPAELTHALSDLETIFGDHLQMASPAHPGPQGDWIAYGTWTLAPPLATPTEPLRDELAVRRRGGPPQQ